MIHRGIPDVNWFNHLGLPVKWEKPAGSLMCWLPAPAKHDDPEGKGRDLLLLFNGTHESLKFSLPEQVRGVRWRQLIDTAAESPKDIYPELDGPLAPANRQVPLTYRSLQVFVSEAAS